MSSDSSKLSGTAYYPSFHGFASSALVLFGQGDEERFAVRFLACQAIELWLKVALDWGKQQPLFSHDLVTLNDKVANTLKCDAWSGQTDVAQDCFIRMSETHCSRGEYFNRYPRVGSRTLPSEASCILMMLDLVDYYWSSVNTLAGLNPKWRFTDKALLLLQENWKWNTSIQAYFRPMLPELFTNDAWIWTKIEGLP